MLEKQDLQQIRTIVEETIDKQDLKKIRTVVREEVTEKFEILDKKIDQLGFDMAELIEDRVLPQIQAIDDKLEALSANTARKSELKTLDDDLRREFRLQHAKRA